jgi:polysaccharide biosynthesis protein PslH
VSRRTIILITPFAPAAGGRHGSARVVHGLGRALADRHDLVLVYPDVGGDVDPDLAGRCVEVRRYATPRLGRWQRRFAGGVALARGRSLWVAELGLRRLRREVRELVGRYSPDVIQVEHGVLGDALASAGAGPLRVVTLYDPAESRRESLSLRREGPAALHRVDAIVAVRQQRRIVSHADGAVVFTERDRALLAPCTPPATELVTISVGWDVPPDPLDPVGSDPPSLLFVGNFMHPPNVDAALRAAREVLPRVRAMHPEATLVLVGPSPPPDVECLAGDHVQVTGAVDDVMPYLDRAAVVIAPLFLGGGTRIKVLEALAAGKAVVATNLAAQGTGAASDGALLVVDTDDEMASAVARLLDDRYARRRLAERARAWAVRELAWSTMADRYDELYDRLERRRSSVPS